MSVLWTICGSGRHVGKTSLALALCEALPDSVYAKLGCGEPKRKGKPEHFFSSETELIAFVDSSRIAHAHVVVECNSWAARGIGDVIIYLEGAPDQGNPREDAALLRSNCHIRLPDGWDKGWSKCKSIIRNVVSDPATAARVCGVLEKQRRFLSSSRVRVRSKLWFEVGGKHVFGLGLASLLDNVGRTGSLSAAAKASGISYRRAWDLIRGAEKRLGAKLILPRVGGTGGGGSELSEDGRRLLQIFRTLNAEVAAYADSRLSACLHGENVDEQV